MRRALLALAMALAPPVAWANCADLALVLAIDASGSIDDHEFALQTAGYAAAFSNPQVLSALEQAGRVDVATILWADSEMPQQIWPWIRIESADDAYQVAAMLAGMDRQISGNTGIGNGLNRALDLLAADQSCAGRMVINVSGDGRESRSPTARQFLPVAFARARAARMDVTINALAISDPVVPVDDWFTQQVITGPGAFVVNVQGFDAFAAGIARKLAREIALPAMAVADGAALIPRL